MTRVTQIGDALLLDGEAFLCVHELLRAFAPTRRARYRAFVADDLDDDLLAEVRGERLGEEAFLRISYADDERPAEVPRAQLEPLRRPLGEVFATTSEPSAPPTVTTATRCASRRALGCHNSTVSRRLCREEAAVRQCKT